VGVVWRRRVLTSDGCRRAWAWMEGPSLEAEVRCSADEALSWRQRGPTVDDRHSSSLRRRFRSSPRPASNYGPASRGCNIN